MHAAPTRAPALPVFPLAALPFASVTTSTTEFLIAKNAHWGLHGKVPIWEPTFLYANRQTPLGLPICSYDSGRRSRCTGKERDAETGLDYFGARYFSAAQGRFTSPDWSPIQQPVHYANLNDPQSLNLYSYVLNNPLSRTDADGHWPWFLAAAGGAVLTDEAPLAFTGPVGWTIIGPTALGVVGVAAYKYFHEDTPAPAPTPAPKPTPAPTPTPAPSPHAGEGDPHAPGDVPNGQTVVRGGQNPPPSLGTYSGSQGATVEEAGRGVPNGQVQVSTGAGIRAAGETLVQRRRRRIPERR